MLIGQIVNPNKRNPISGNLVGYKLVPAPSQLILAHPDSICYRRAEFAGHHLWVTSHQEGELFAGGHYTQQNRGNANGVKTWAAREDNVKNAEYVSRVPSLTRSADRLQVWWYGILTV